MFLQFGHNQGACIFGQDTPVSLDRSHSTSIKVLAI